MRLATLETDNGARAVAAVEGRFVDLHAADPALADTLAGLCAGLSGNLPQIAAAARRAVSAAQFVTGRLLAPIPHPGKVICIGLNYRDHAHESGAPIPTEPICLSKLASDVIGKEETIEMQAVCKKVE